MLTFSPALIILIRIWLILRSRSSAITVLPWRSAADLASAMTNLSEDDYDYNVSITTAHNATQLATINNASQGDIIFTGSNNAIELTGTATVVSQALAGLDYAGNVILTEGSATTTEINTINTATTGTINGLALTSITGVASTIETSLGYLNTKPQEQPQSSQVQQTPKT